MDNSIRVTKDGYYTKWWGEEINCRTLEKAIFVNVLETIMMEMEKKKIK